MANSTPVPVFEPDDPSWTLLSQGAEARVWKQGTVVCKERFPKRYRHPTLDARLTKARCRMEARMLQKCTERKMVNVPQVLRTEHALIYMEFVEGASVRQALDQHHQHNNNSNTIAVSDLAQQLGQALACLHNQGIVHGDLTTSNMILRPTSTNNDATRTELVFIDFGLAKHSTSVEEKAVDLYVLERAIASTHASLPAVFWETALRVYGEHSATTTKQQETLARLEQVRQRGRKRECFG